MSKPTEETSSKDTKGGSTKNSPETRNTTDIALLGKASRERVFGALSRVTSAVASTLGAKGKNVILIQNGRPWITNDGISIARHIHFHDPIEEAAAQLLKEVAFRTNQKAGDGTTTSIVLAHAIIKEAFESDSTMQIKNELDEAHEYVQKEIDKQIIPVTSPEQIKQVATISVEDEKLGEQIADIYTKIGKEGFVVIENSKTPETTYTINEGSEIRVGRASKAFINQQNGDWKVEKPLVLITTETLVTNDILPLANKVVDANRPLVIIYREMSDDCMGNFVFNHLEFLQGRKKIPYLLIKSPTIYPDEFFEDCAQIFNTKVWHKKEGMEIKNLELSDLGTCTTLTADDESFKVFGGADCREYVAHKRQMLLDLERMNEVHERRLGSLMAAVAVLNVGASSETELVYKKLKVEDAVNATKYAMRDGVLVGGGITLLDIAKGMEVKNEGFKVLKQALMAPVKQIIKNAGKDIDVEKLGKTYHHHTDSSKKDSIRTEISLGFNAKTGEIVDMLKAGILDPVTVTKAGVTNAVSVAGTFLTSEGVIPEFPRD
jgi:chaperonin GroEL